MTVAPDDFLRFWTSYPKRRDQPDAIDAWYELAPSPSLVEEVLAGLERWKRSTDWHQEQGKYIPWPAKFLRTGRWKDDPDVQLPFGSARTAGNVAAGEAAVAAIMGDTR